MPQYSLLKIFCRSLRTLSFIRSQDSITNGALVIARFQLATGIRPVGRNELHTAMLHAYSPSYGAAGAAYQDLHSLRRLAGSTMMRDAELRCSHMGLGSSSRMSG